MAKHGQAIFFMANMAKTKIKTKRKKKTKTKTRTKRVYIGRREPPAHICPRF